MRATAAALVAAALLAAPAGAQAQGRIVAGTPNRYVTPEVTIAAGDSVVFANQDMARHDVVAEKSTPGGEPLFRSPLVDPGGEAPVAGAQGLGAGEYAFLCSVHPSMRGTLRVTGEDGESPPPPDPGDDTAAPELAVEVTGGSLRRRVQVSVASDEPATVALVARVRVRGRTVRLGRARAELTAAGQRELAIRVTRRARKALRGVRRANVRVTATATDAVGNEAEGTAARRLRR